MSIPIDIPITKQSFVDIPRLCDQLGLIFGCRDKFDNFIPNKMGMELIITKWPYGRGVNLRMGLFNTEVYLPTPCTTSDLEVFMALIREITKKQKAKEVFCLGNPIKIKALNKVEEIAKFDMAEAIKHYSKIDPLENYIYIMTPFARIVVDEAEQALFKNSQEKFDTYINEKQLAKGINNQVTPEILISDSGISSIIFVDAGRYLIVPKTITRIGTNQIIKETCVINGEHKMDYATFLEKVPHFKTKFDAEHFIIKFSKKDFLTYAKKYNYKAKAKTSATMPQKQKSKSTSTTLGLTSNDIYLLNQYFKSMANLYGVISLQDAFNIIQEQTSNHFTKKQFLAFARLKNDEYLNYTIATLNPFKPVIDFENDIVSNKLLEVNSSPYKYIKRAQEHKKYYTPSQSELLKYADENYLDNTKSLKQLTTYLKKHAILYYGLLSAEEIVQSFTKEVKSAVMTIPIESLLHAVTAIKDCNEEDFLQKIVKLVQELHNHTRLWINRGYTPQELSDNNGIDPNNIKFF